MRRTRVREGDTLKCKMPHVEEHDVGVREEAVGGAGGLEEVDRTMTQAGRGDGKRPHAGRCAERRLLNEAIVVEVSCPWKRNLPGAQQCRTKPASRQTNNPQSHTLTCSSACSLSARAPTASPRSAAAESADSSSLWRLQRKNWKHFVCTQIAQHLVE